MVPGRFFGRGVVQDAVPAFTRCALPSHACVVSCPFVIASDFQTGFNLVVCYYALGDADRMRKGFTKLLSIPPPVGEEDEDEDGKDADNKDSLKEELRERHKTASRFVTIAAKLIAPTLDGKDWVTGFDWVIEALRQEHDLIASEILITKALTYLRNKNFEKAVEVLKSFEKKDTALKAKAATNLSFLYFLEGDVAQADKYANLAVRHDRYNAKALVNKGALRACVSTCSVARRCCGCWGP